MDYGPGLPVTPEEVALHRLPQETQTEMRDDMSKLNKGSRLLTAPLQTEPTPTGFTHEGAPGFAREEKTELFMRATTVFAGEGSFYEDGIKADARANELVRKLAVQDWEWVKGFLPWLRSEANIRTMSLMLAVEAVYARAKAGLKGEGARQLIDSVMLRADEPGEVTQYVLATIGHLPRGGSVKAGIADGAARLYNQTSALRYDKPGLPMRFADVIDLVRPRPKVTPRPEDFEGEWDDHQQSKLFKYLLDERHHGDGSVDGLFVISARRELNKLTARERHALAAAALDNRDGWEHRKIQRAAARQWEWVLSWLGEGAGNISTALTERQRWELVIPWMGYMAVIRNLRNFEEAGVGKSLINKINDKIADPEEVANSRQLPFRFFSAHMNTRSVKWQASLEEALQASIQNVPVLDGRTLILIDTSGSMQAPLSQRPSKRRSTAKVPDRVDAAALFALALGIRNVGKVDVYGFATGNFFVENLGPGASLLRLTQAFAGQVGRVGHGTEIEANVRRTFDSRKHTRVAIFTDMQAFPYADSNRLFWGGYSQGDVMSALPAGIPVYAWNLAGYSNSAMATGNNRYELAGLTDASFGIMQRLEQGRSADWPWLKAPVRSTPDE